MRTVYPALGIYHMNYRNKHDFSLTYKITFSERITIIQITQDANIFNTSN